MFRKTPSRRPKINPLETLFANQHFAVVKQKPRNPNVTPLPLLRRQDNPYDPSWDNEIKKP